MKAFVIAGACALLALAGCQRPAATASGPIDQARIEAAAPGDWLSHGRTYSEQRFSPLQKISIGNVSRLGLAWSYDTQDPRAAESTPIVANGVMYVTSAWSMVYALDAKTGRELWTYDPQVPHERGASACCDVANRGVAIWKDKIYLGALDGRLIALDAKTGQVVWSKVTVDQSQPYTITGAPRVAKGLVFIGNGGAEYGVRGYVTAYDAETGDQKWRFYTVPGDPKKGPDHAASDPQMAMAAKTWNGKFWQYGGGGTVWDSIVYDPELDQLYIGVGNGAPWNQQVRSPGGGDNLFLSSIVALNPNDGHYLWHYQTTPGESWDFTATQQITLATLKIGGADRKVLMQAPKNGFFYVIDRTNGKLISAKNFVPMARAADTPAGAPISWAYGIDEKTGRPLENEAARYKTPHVLVTPAPFGAHNWHPMSFDPQTGLVYIPAQELPTEWISDPHFKYRPGRWNTATSQGTAPADLPEAMQAGMKNLLKGYLLAWDPIAQKEVWRAPHAGPWNGGTLSTAGGLVFQGTVDGKFEAHDAKSGKQLWAFDNQAATLAGPISYEIDGEQYVAVESGYGSVFFLAAGFAAPKTGERGMGARISVFKIGGTAKLPASNFAPLETPAPPMIKISAQQAAIGAQDYGDFCAACHGIGVVSGGVTPDLRRTPLLSDGAAFRAVVHGQRKAAGMPDFSRWISDSDVDAIRAYIAHEAQPLYAAEQAKKKAP